MVVDKNLLSDPDVPFDDLATTDPMVRMLEDERDYLELPKGFVPIAEYTCKLTTYLVIQQNISTNGSDSASSAVGKKFVVPKAKFFPPTHSFEKLDCLEESPIIENLLDYQMFKADKGLDLTRRPNLPLCFLEKSLISNFDECSESFCCVQINQIIFPDKNDTFDNAITKFCLITEDGRKLFLPDLYTLYKENKILDDFFGLVVYWFLENVDVEFLERFMFIVESDIRFKNGSKNDLASFKFDASWGAYLYISDSNNDAYKNALKIVSLPRLASVFNFYFKYSSKELNDYVKRDRLVLNPFVSDELEIQEPNRFAKIGRVEDVNPKRRHFCHDAIYCKELGLHNRGFVVDGAGGHPGGALFSAFIVDKIAKGLNPDRLNNPVDLQKFKLEFDELEASVAGKLKPAVAALYDYPVAVFAGVDFVRREGSQLKMYSLGDSVAIHLDQNMRFLGLVGAESSNYGVLSEDESITDAQISQYLHSNYIDSFLAPHKFVGNVSQYSAVIQKGDIIIVASDWLEKVFNRALVDQLFRENKIRPEKDYNYNTVIKGDIAQRSIKENRNRQSRIYGLKVFPFIVMLGKFAQANNLSFEYEQLVQFLRMYMPNGEDDSSIIAYKV